MSAIISSQEGVLVGLISAQGVLTGIIRAEGIFYGTVHSHGNLVGSLSIPVDYEDYIGSYSVTPMDISQTVSTNDKHLTDDIVVKAVPFFEVDNLHDGQTIIIGE